MTSRLSESQRSALVGDNALQRLNSLDEVARFIAFLATMKNVSGQVFQLDSRLGPWT
jgi:3-oxoacyl-[acyl-carrier protein] reductase